ncbi:CbtA family protein [Thalassovita aquimarina]|uniref:CbtA family protein n=1 Tax=Thalassovita aquimarina TaxID=2785917 RepID=A0ABS5HQ95_9RHOB|nr:CbtA family protein [Thalassovita aquimarina]MBR9651120.1 CbtA family protein [Thalassovita aquimarina]
MTRHLLTSALIAGVAAGFLAALLQFTFTVPLLLEGELYETGARIHFSANGSPSSDAGHPPVWGEIGRHFGTLGMNLVSYTGFAFIMVAGFALAERSGHRLSPRIGLIWGLAGFVAINLAPSFGLPPELPGSIAAELTARQAWWISCVGATIIALALFAFGRGPVAITIGVVLIALPHLIGAPRLDTYFGVAAPELAAHFATRSLGVAAASWVLLGLIAATLYTKRD